MTEEEFLQWLFHAQMALKRHHQRYTMHPYGLEVRLLDRKGGRLRMMIQTHSDVLQYDPITAVATHIGPRKIYGVSQWQEAARDLGLSTESAWRIHDAIYDEDTANQDLRQRMLAVLQEANESYRQKERIDKVSDKA